MLVRGFSDFSIKTPDCHPGVPAWIAHFRLDADITHIFPYINAVVEDAFYYKEPPYIRFHLDGIRCALYPDKVVASSFADRDQALTFISRLIDFLNDLDSKKNSIEPSYKEYKHISVLEVFKLLPKTNCRACGFLSCMAFANALSRREAVFDDCPEVKKANSEITDKLQIVLS